MEHKIGEPFIRDLIRCNKFGVSEKQEIVVLMRKMYPDAWHKVDFDKLFDYVPSDPNNYTEVARVVWDAIDIVYGKKAIMAFYIWIDEDQHRENESLYNTNTE